MRSWKSQIKLSESKIIIIINSSDILKAMTNNVIFRSYKFPIKSYKKVAVV